MEGAEADCLAHGLTHEQLQALAAYLEARAEWSRRLDDEYRSL